MPKTKQHPIKLFILNSDQKKTPNHYGIGCQSDPDTVAKFNYIGFTCALHVSALRAQFHRSQGKALYWLQRVWLRLLVNSFKSYNLLPKMQLTAYPADVCRKEGEAERNCFTWYDCPNSKVALWKWKTFSLVILFKYCRCSLSWICQQRVEKVRPTICW